MSEDKQPLRVRYEYDEDPALRLQYAHGVWGGINPHGEVELNFYTESDKLPSFSEQFITPDGSFSHETAPYDKHLKVVRRRIHTKLLLNYHTVKAMIEWLQEKSDTLESEDGEGFFFDDEKSFRH
jgi:hypothetical protein